MKTLFKALPLLIITFFQGMDYHDDYTNHSDEHGPWKLVSDKGDLKVYKRTRAGTNLKELRIDNVFNVSAERMVRALDDVDGYVDWIYKCSEAKIITQPSKNEVIYYTRADVPAPIWDRDILSHSTYNYYPESDTHYYKAYAAENDEEYVPVRKKIVRVKDYGSSWTIKEIEPGTVETINTIYMDPGGSIPNWMANMTIQKGPIKSMRSLAAKMAEEE